MSDVRDCPQCEREGRPGTKANYDDRVLVSGRGVYWCPECGCRWQDENEEPSLSAKGVWVHVHNHPDDPLQRARCPRTPRGLYDPWLDE